MRALAPALALLLVASPWTVGAQGDSQSDFVIEDPVGDVKVEVFPAGQLPTPDLVGTPATDNVDLVALSVEGEDHETIWLRLTVNDLSSVLRNLDGQDILDYRVSFQVAGSSVTYFVHWSLIGLNYNTALFPNDAPRPLWGGMCIATPDTSCAKQRATVYLDIPNDGFLVEIPKLSLLGHNPRDQATPPGLPTELPQGAKITQWEAFAQKRGLATIFANIFVWLSDVIGPVDREYSLRFPAANDMVKIRSPVETTRALPQGFGWSCFPAAACMAGGDEYVVAAAPGEATRIPITIENKGATKRLIALEATMEGDAGKWSAEVAPSIEVPGKGTRKASVLLNASSTLLHKETTTVVVTGTSIGYPDEVGVLRITVHAAVPPSPDSPDLHFHMAGPTGECLDLVVFGCNYVTRAWLNTILDDPDGTFDSEGFQQESFNWGTDGSYLFRMAFGLDTALVTPLAFDLARPLVAEITLSAPRSVSTELQVVVGVTPGDSCNPGYCTEYTAIASATQQIDVSAKQTHTVNLVLNPEFRTLSPAQGRPMAFITVRSADLTATFGLADGLMFHASESRLSLPLIETGTGGPRGASPIGLYAAGDIEEFLNPGKTKAFHVLVVNEGTAGDRVEVSATADVEKWQTSFRPATKYQLAPGESVNVTLLVAAPSEAQEGDRTVINVLAKSLNGTGETALTLAAIATTGIQIEDEAEAAGDEEAAARALSDDGGDSPALGVMAALLAAVGGAALAIRRRRA